MDLEREGRSIDRYIYIYISITIYIKHQKYKYRYSKISKILKPYDKPTNSLSLEVAMVYT